MRGRNCFTVFVVALNFGAAASAQGLLSLAEMPAKAQSPADPFSFTNSTWNTAPVLEAPPSMVQSPVQSSAQASIIGESCGKCCYDFNICRLPCHYVQVDGLFWHRVGTGCSDSLVINGNTGDELLNTDSLNFDPTGGIRVLVGWQPHWMCTDCCAWELSYFGIFGWSATESVTGSGNLAIPGDLGLSSNNFFGADQIGVRYESQFQNLELNCVKACCVDECTRLDFLCGFRYIYLNDDLVLTATDLQEGTSAYHINANNNLYGLQVGGRYNRAFCRWSAQVTGKAGIFYNDAQQRQVVTDFPDTPSSLVLRDARGSGDNVAMLGELGIVFSRPINDTWSLRFGYTAIGVGGLALATDQLDFTDSFGSGTGFSQSGWFFAHGGLLGLQAAW
jgi:hypothetical protein